MSLASRASAVQCPLGFSLSCFVVVVVFMFTSVLFRLATAAVRLMLTLMLQYHEWEDEVC